MRTTQRGSALLTAVVAVLVITVIAVGIIRFSGRESAGATATSLDHRVRACAEAARLQLLAQFHALGFQPSTVQALNLPLGTTAANGPIVARGGHYDTPVGNIVIDQVTYLPETAGGPVTTARDLTSVSSRVGQGGRPVKVVVHCVDGSRQLEVEFGIRFGL